MADEDRQPPQSYDTTTPAGVGATTSNQVSPGTIQEILDTGDSSLIDQAFDQMTVEDMIAYVDQLPSPPPFRTSSPAGVGSPGSQSFRSIHTTPPSSPDTPLSRGSAGLSSGARTPLSQGSARLSSGARTPATPPSVPRAAGARTAAGAGGNGGGRGGGGRGGGDGRGRRGPRTRGGGRGAGGAGGAGGGGGRGAGGGAGAGAGGGGGGGEVVVEVVVVVDDGGDDADDFSPLHLPPPLPDRLGGLADNLVPCVKPIYNDVYACYYKIKNNWPKDGKLLM